MITNVYRQTQLYLCLTPMREITGRSVTVRPRLVDKEVPHLASHNAGAVACNQLLPALSSYPNKYTCTHMCACMCGYAREREGSDEQLQEERMDGKIGCFIQKDIHLRAERWSTMQGSASDVGTEASAPANLLYSSKNQAISREPVFMSGAGMSSWGPITSARDCTPPSPAHLMVPCVSGGLLIEEAQGLHYAATLSSMVMVLGLLSKTFVSDLVWFSDVCVLVERLPHSCRESKIKRNWAFWAVRGRDVAIRLEYIQQDVSCRMKYILSTHVAGL